MVHINQEESGGEHFEKFTERARRVLSLAHEESQRFNHNYIGSEHLLLGLVREGDGVAGMVLRNLGVELSKVRSAVEFVIGRGDRVVLGQIGLTPRAKKIIELAVDEARRFNHHYIGDEHLLLGLVREGEGIAAGVLESLGVSLERVRTETIRVLSQGGATPTGMARGPVRMGAAFAAPESNAVTCYLDNRTLDALDALVEAGAHPNRADAAAWLITAGLTANAPLLTHVRATVSEIRRLRAEARGLTQQRPTRGAYYAPANDSPPPEG